MTAGVYIHIPFCDIRCGYCDFFTVADQREKMPEYLDALLREIDITSAQPQWRQERFATLYFGGGTPSLLTPDQLARIIAAVSAHFHLTADPEVTLETNPTTVDRAKLAAFRDAGINRLSLGVQSFHEHELKFLDRDHSVAESVAAFEAARAAGFDNVSFDLIYTLPGQTLAQWQATLDHTTELGPEHISAYTLTYEKGTPLFRQLQSGSFRVSPEEKQRQMQLTTIECLHARGFEQYEVSNFSRPGVHSRHNQKYWDNSPYLGLGASAHSYRDDRRYWNVRSISGYLDALRDARFPVAGEDVLGRDEIEFETVYLGLRQNRGVHLLSFEQRTGQSLFARYAKTVRKFFPLPPRNDALMRHLTSGAESLSGEYMRIEDGYLRLTREGFLVCDAICADFL